MVRPIAPQLRQQGWQICVGASGTVQALQEIMVAQGMDERITLPKLRQLKQRAIQCGKLEELEIEGLTLERALVFPSGLSILLAIFRELGIESMMLAGGALREGTVYGMLHLPVEQDIRIRTIRNLQRRYLIDTEQAERVSQLAANFAAGRQRVAAGCAMSRTVAQRQSDPRTRPQRRFQAGAATRRLPDPQPGLTRLYPGAEKLLATLLQNQSNTLDLSLLNQQNALPPRTAQRLCRILRPAIIFASRRRDDTLPAVRLRANQDDELTVILPPGWLEQHPLRAEALEQESHWQSYVHWTLRLEEQR